MIAASGNQPQLLRTTQCQSPHQEPMDVISCNHGSKEKKAWYILHMLLYVQIEI